MLESGHSRPLKGDVMTISTSHPDQVFASEQDDRDSSQLRRLRIVVALLAILGLTLGAILIATGDEDSGASNAPDDVIQLVEDFERAFEEQDVELIQSIITEDFSATAQLYNPDTAKPAFTAGLVSSSLTSEINAQTWNVERSGDRLVAGDGPWVVAARETWSDRFNRDEGTRIYIIVDEDGTPKIAGYYYVGILYDVMPDFGS
jgi:hypothetical protein